MQRRLSIFLAAGAVAVQAGTIAYAGLVADANGTRLVLRTGEEPLSRVLQEADGTLSLEVQGSRTALQGLHALAANSWFTSIEASNSVRDGADIAVFRFHPAGGRREALVLHREWDGRDISFVLDKSAAKTSLALLWSVPLPSSGASEVLASLSTVPSLEGVRAWGSGDMETMEFRFSGPTQKAELAGAGKSFSVHLGKARLAHLGLQASAARLLQGLSQGKDGEIKISLKETPKSILLTRSGNSVVVRMVAASPLSKAWAWTTGGKVETFGGSTLPGDETVNVAALRKDLKPQGGEGFTAEGSRSPTDVRGALNSGSSVSGDRNALGEAQKLEAERRKSQEFSDRQVAESSAKQAVEDQKNKVVYNTFGIRDPFIPLEADDAEGGLNIDQMRVVGIIASPTRPMAVLEHTSQPGLSVALREGDAIQNGRVLKIERDRVVFLLEEFGVSRQFALKLQAPKGEKS
jgi:Tfp pilus assembly protein PilP